MAGTATAEQPSVLVTPAAIKPRKTLLQSDIRTPLIAPSNSSEVGTVYIGIVSITQLSD